MLEYKALCDSAAGAHSGGVGPTLQAAASVPIPGGSPLPPHPRLVGRMRWWERSFRHGSEDWGYYFSLFFCYRMFLAFYKYL